MSCRDIIISKINNEYEITRSGEEQRRWAEDIKNQVINCNEVHLEYRLKLKKTPFKRYIEEVLPISCFVSTDPRFCSASVTLREGNQPFDAEVLIDDKIEYIEVVNAMDGYIHHLQMKVINLVGVITGYQSQTPIKLIIECIQAKINMPYVGVYHLLVCIDFDHDIFNFDSMREKIKQAIGVQTKFKSITIYERGSKSILYL